MPGLLLRLLGKLKRNIVFWPVQIRIGRGAWGGGSGSGRLAGLGRASFASSFAWFTTTGGSSFSGTEELDILPDYFEHTIYAEGVEVETCFKETVHTARMGWICNPDQCLPLKCIPAEF